MNRHSFSSRLTVLLVLGGLSTTTPVGGQPEKSGQSVSKAMASVDLVPGESRVFVTVRNLSNAAIEAWRYRVTYDLGSGPSSMEVTLDAGLDPDSPTNGAIQPHTARRRDIVLPGIPIEASATVQVLILSDGTSEGVSEYRDRIFRDRERRADTLALWIEALQRVSGMQGPDAKLQLQRIRQSDKRYAPDPTDSWALAADQNIKDLLSNSDDLQLPGRLSTLLQKYRTQKDRALRHTRR